MSLQASMEEVKDEKKREIEKERRTILSKAKDLTPYSITSFLTSSLSTLSTSLFASTFQEGEGETSGPKKMEDRKKKTKGRPKDQSQKEKESPSSSPTFSTSSTSSTCGTPSALGRRRPRWPTGDCCGRSPTSGGRSNRGVRRAGRASTTYAG